MVSSFDLVTSFTNEKILTSTALEPPLCIAMPVSDPFKWVEPKEPRCELDFDFALD
jgi:hypothetical protein